MKTKTDKPEARQVVPIRLRGDELAPLEREARRRRMPVTTLAREILVAAGARAEKRAQRARE